MTAIIFWAFANAVLSVAGFVLAMSNVRRHRELRLEMASYKRALQRNVAGSAHNAEVARCLRAACTALADNDRDAWEASMTTLVRLGELDLGRYDRAVDKRLN